MIIFLIFLFLVLLLVCCAFLIKPRLYAYLSLNEVRIYIKLGYFKIPLYPSDKKNTNTSTPSDDKTENGIKVFRDFWNNNSSDIKRALLCLKKRLLVEKFNFEYECGFSDAAVTAIMYGVVNSLYYSVFSFFDMHFKVKEMKASILPAFNVNKKHIALDSVFRLSFADIIYIMAGLLRVIKKLKKQL